MAANHVCFNAMDAPALWLQDSQFLFCHPLGSFSLRLGIFVLVWLLFCQPLRHSTANILLNFKGLRCLDFTFKTIEKADTHIHLELNGNFLEQFCLTVDTPMTEPLSESLR